MQSINEFEKLTTNTGSNEMFLCGRIKGIVF